MTQGSSTCTGLKKFDVDRAETSALANLSRMINAHVNSVQYGQQTSLGYGVITNSFTEKTMIKTDLLLKNAHITARWVDVAFCTVYAASQVSIDDAINAIKHQQQTEKNRLLNQLFFINAKASNLVNGQLSNLLAELGVKTTEKIELSTVVIESHVLNVRHLSDTLLKLILSVAIKEKLQGNIIWQHSVKGKAFSYKAKEQVHLTRIALADALEKLTPTLKQTLITRSLHTDGK